MSEQAPRPESLESQIKEKFAHLTDDDLIRRMNAAGECAVDECARPVKGRGLCNMHWYRWRRTGDVGEAKPRRLEHGQSDHELYPIWQAMRERCLNKSHPSYSNYGGRGIAICERWDDFTLFLKDMGKRPSGYSIERVDGDGDYEPENCIWATRTRQNINRRTPRGAATQYRGVTKETNRWAARIGLEHVSVWIGTFATDVEAAWMRDQWAIELHGDAARLNFHYQQVKPAEGAQR